MIGKSLEDLGSMIRKDPTLLLRFLDTKAKDQHPMYLGALLLK
jgi:hypothetical protein